jgi:uncharacterized membrane-anchored protein
MKRTKNELMLVSILVMMCIWGFVVFYEKGFIPTGLDLFIFVMIVIGAVYALVTAIRRQKDVESGFPAEDEMSTRIKYKAGYFAFMFSLYMWLFIFLLHRFFPDVETMLGGGILLSAVMSMAIKVYLTRNFHENQD